MKKHYKNVTEILRQQNHNIYIYHKYLVKLQLCNILTLTTNN
jgi:hypothetical protein